MTETTHTQQFWEDFYRERPVWSGRPNVLLVREVEALPPGTALDLGCAEGADAVWLAQRGWRVVGADVSASALRRAAAHAAEAGVEVDWQRHDLFHSFPDGAFDLVCAQYLHSPVEAAGQRTAVLRRAAAAVALGGLLLVVGHQERPSARHDEPADEHAHEHPGGHDEQHADVHLPTTGEVLADLDLDSVAWTVELEDVVDRTAAGPDGRVRAFRDNVLRVRRAAAPAMS